MSNLVFIFINNRISPFPKASESLANNQTFTSITLILKKSLENWENYRLPRKKEKSFEKVRSLNFTQNVTNKFQSIHSIHSPPAAPPVASPQPPLQSYKYSFLCAIPPPLIAKPVDSHFSSAFILLLLLMMLCHRSINVRTIYFLGN